MQNKKRNYIKILLIALILVAAGVVYSCAAGKMNPANRAAAEEETEEKNSEKKAEQVHAEDAPPKEAESLTEPEQICVHVCGSVASPGVYYLPKGARVFEAVEKAGGLSEDADSGYVNLAEEAEDGSKIYIPSQGEVEEGFVPEEEAAGKDVKDGLVNINKASVEELKTLPGIGDVKANAIVSYRESVGGFSSVEDIMNVAGIKNSSFEQIKDLIRV